MFSTFLEIPRDKRHKELDEHILLLILSVLLHSIFSIGSFVFIFFYALNIHSPIIDFIVSITVISFLVFNRCVAIDVYEYIRAGRSELPSVASDDLARNILKNFLRSKTKKKDKKLPSLRLDILTNVKPFTLVQEEETLLKFLSRKMHYTVINIILTVILLIKYDKQWLIPMLIPWLSMNFKP
jgi:hypothetical protein